MLHNCRACARERGEPLLLKTAGPGACAPQQEKPSPQLESSPRALQPEDAGTLQWRPSTVKIHNKIKKKKKKNTTSSRQKDPEHRAGAGWHGCWSQPVGPVWLSHLPGAGLVNCLKLVRLLHISFPLVNRAKRYSPAEGFLQGSHM